jgi:hypothetical protein
MTDVILMIDKVKITQIKIPLSALRNLRLFSPVPLRKVIEFTSEHLLVFFTKLSLPQL